MTLYDINIIDQNNEEISMSVFRNKVILVANTATHCGFSNQFTELEQLHQKYKDEDLVVLAFPCNQFANQTPEDIEGIKNICELKYGITFEQYQKVNVNGKNTAPLFLYLKSTSSIKLIKWNFNKFLIDSNGNFVKHYNSLKKTLQIENDILKLLK